MRHETIFEWGYQMSRAIHKLTSLVLLFSLVFSSFNTTHAQAAVSTSVSDIKGHWAEAQINSWISQGFIKGYDDGSFKPNKAITRAEFFVLINQAFHFNEKTE